MEEILAAIKLAVTNSKLSEAAVSRLAVGNPSAIKNLRVRQGSALRNHPIETLAAVAEVLDLELYLGPKRPTIPKTDQVAAETEFVRVKRYAVQLSAGPGAINDQTEQLAPVAFRARWMQDRMLNADSCCVVSISGASMEPMLCEGDLVMLDMTKKSVIDRHVYALVDLDGTAKVKRLQKINGGLLISSDNPTTPAELRSGTDAARVEIIGKVVWSSHEWSSAAQPP